MKVLVYLEERNGQIRKPSFEAISAAQSLGATEIAGCFASANDAGFADQIAGYALQKVYAITDAKFEHYSSRAAAKAVAEAAKAFGADVVIVGATGRGKDLAPRVAVRLEAGYVPDVTEIKVDGENITATHPVYAGKSVMHIRPTTKVKIFSNRPNLWKAVKGESAAPSIEALAVSFDERDFAAKTTELTLSQGKIDVAEADVIVSGGRGMKGPENWPLLEELASAFNAATGASRAVVDAGWRPHSEQVGQTGKTVSPTLYVAVGISGAVQHLAGMSSSKTIVAINKDANAPIFNVVDYGIVGDIFEVLPALTAEVKRIRGGH